MVTDPADPRRCKFSYPHEQCWREAEAGCDFCLVHGGKSKAEAEDTRLYHLAEVDNRRRLAELSSHERIKSLREEIGLAAGKLLKLGEFFLAPGYSSELSSVPRPASRCPIRAGCGSRFHTWLT